MKLEIPDEMMELAIFGVRLTLNANDTFAYACADCVTIDESGIPLMTTCFERWGQDGVTAFMAAVRDCEPIKPWRTPAYTEAREWLKSQEIPAEVEGLFD